MRRTLAAGFGGAGGQQALAWAAEEAGQSEADLMIVYACPPGSPLDVGLGDPSTVLVELTDPPLAQRLTATRSTLGGHRVTLRIRAQEPSVALVDASAAVDLLVIGAGEGGSTVRRVLRHAHGPVVVVRPVATGHHTLFPGHVVVGVDGSDAGHAALDFAFTHAAEHHFPVAAVHVSAHPVDDYFDDDVTRSTHSAAEPAARELLDAEVEPWALKYPRVRVRRAVLSGSVADGLLRAGAGAYLLVTGDRRRGLVGRVRTGDVPFTVARCAGCPVAVVPFDGPAVSPPEEELP